MSVREMSDSVFDALFRQAVIDNLYEEIDSLPPDDELAEMYKPSDAHKERMKRLFAKEARKERLAAFAKWSRRAAAVILISATVLFAALMSVPQVRAVVAQTIIEWYEQFTRFTSNAPEAESASMEPTYIPEGFTEDFRDEMEGSILILYSNAHGEIILFESSLASGLISVDNEFAEYELIAIDGIEYHVFTAIEPGGENSIIWELGGWRYLLSSTVNVEHLQKMAESLED